MGCWINDVSSVPRIEAWPATVLDAGLEGDLVALFDLMSQTGFDAIVLFGLFVARNWETDFGRSVSEQRAKAVRRLLDGAHKRGVRVLYGLGLYSWGFDKIIAETPEVQGSNPAAMCASRSASHAVMERLVDYLLGQYDFDGFHFESGDLGRCECGHCRQKPDHLYHIELNRRMAAYVKQQWPDKFIEVYAPGPAHTTLDHWLAWGPSSQYLDVLIDDWNRAGRFGCKSRQRLISTLQCAYGTRSGAWVYPPQRWDRLRWFVPIIEQRALHYRQLADDGGTAAMVQVGPMLNPAEEATFRCTGKFLQNPYRDVAGTIRETVDQMFQARSPGVADELADLFWAAEKAYFATALFWSEGGELFIEPLFGAVAGPPTYLSSRMYSHQLTAYESAMRDVQTRFQRIKSELDNRPRADQLGVCLANVLHDIQGVAQQGTCIRDPEA